MKKRFQRWWFKRVIYPGIMRHKAESAYALKETILWQMWHAGVRFEHINKWLIKMNHRPIVAYCVNSRGGIQIFYELPSDERRKELDGRLIQVR
jgi:hypothetical protein